MKISNQELINDLINRTQEVRSNAIRFTKLPFDTLNWKADADAWSILECLEHLNRYGDFYIPEFKKRMPAAQMVSDTAVFRSGWLGNYFAISLLPKEKLNKMNTFKSMNPVGSDLGPEVLEKFISQQEELLGILNQARNLNLTRTKTSISISKWIKLRLGDSFRVLIYHNQRHIVQANRVLERGDLRVERTST